MAKPQIAVWHSGYEKIVDRIHREHAESLVMQGSAIRYQCGIRLVEIGIPHQSRTRIARDKRWVFDADGNRIYPMRDVIGLSQVYTTRNERHRVDGYKTFDSRDRCVFHAATLDCMTVAAT